MKETKYAGTQTEKNLMAAFAGESEARNKYTLQLPILDCHLYFTTISPKMQ